jgi:phosphoribosylformylglycinamidine synthase PurS subunit
MVVGFTRAIVADRAAAGETLVLISGTDRQRQFTKAQFTRNSSPGTGRREPVARIVVDVMLRKEIHDPQGEAIASAAHRLGFGQVLGVRQGKRFEVELTGPADESALARMAELAGELLANPVIEEFTLHES